MDSSSDSPSLQLPSVAFFGRTFHEYCRFFDLDRVPLRGLRILDAGAGPSSFAAEALERGANPVALDPLYGCGAPALAAYVQSDYGRMFREIRRNPALVTCGYFRSIESAEASRRSAAARFLADYADGFAQGRYVGGALPRLPFPDRAFDLVLCAHLLFLYAACFDPAWHLSACLELVRVSSGKVRIHPVCGLGGKPYPGLGRLREELGRRGIGSRVVPVDYRFFAGADTLLVLERGSGS
jgi:SAM-dependent methyltransferase